MNAENTQLAYAVVGAIIFFTLREGIRWWTTRPIGASTKAGNPSPGLGVRFVEWVRLQTRRDPDPDPDPDPANLTQDFDWGSIDHTESHNRKQILAQREPLPRPVVPPARPSAPVKPGPRPPEKLDAWVAASMRNGAAQRHLISEAGRIFGASSSTVKRSMRRARKAQM